ncbi:glycoside hydrolase family 3 C-terminal domain-containing protein [Massilia sp. H-1]|nr:glycoside hydrolase family 3 C-terminal domain-containing protein [Massilia sp. H-1]
MRESLVLLKNDTGALPLAPGKKILVVGKSADNIANQSGGWSLTWQGTDNKNSDFPNADSILKGIEQAAGAANVHYSANASGVDVARFDAVIAVIGETPYAEGDGDIGPSGTLRHSGRHPEDLAVLQAVAGKGKPVITVLVSGLAAVHQRPDEPVRQFCRRLAARYRRQGRGRRSVQGQARLPRQALVLVAEVGLPDRSQCGMARTTRRCSPTATVCPMAARRASASSIRPMPTAAAASPICTRYSTRPTAPPGRWRS